MAKINVGWDSESRSVIRYTFEAGWSWTDYQTAISTAAELLNTSGNPAHVIMDFSSASILPGGAINYVQKALQYPRHELVRVTAIVGANAFIKRIADIGQKLSRNNWDLVFVSSNEEAYQRFDDYAARGGND